MKFKIFDEVMDKDGRQYTIVGYKDLLYEIMYESSLASVTKVGEFGLAKYDPILGPVLAQIAEQVAKTEGMLKEVKNMQESLFQKARDKP